MKYFQLYLDAFRKFVDFKGKEKRTAFWSFVIISAIIALLLGAIVPAIATLYGVVVLIPSIMLCIRRGRDIGTPLLALVAFIPIIGLLILGFMPANSFHV